MHVDHARKGLGADDQCFDGHSRLEVGLGHQNPLNPTGAPGEDVKRDGLGVGDAQLLFGARGDRRHLVDAARTGVDVTKILSHNDEVELFGIPTRVGQRLTAGFGTNVRGILIRTHVAALLNFRYLLELLNDNFVSIRKRIPVVVHKLVLQKSGIRYDNLGKHGTRAGNDHSVFHGRKGTVFRPMHFVPLPA